MLYRLTLKYAIQRKTYRYFSHTYNYAWKNERTIEIPFFQKILEAYDPKEILEIGNVLSHYQTIHHDVLDKYEVSNGVINQDIVGFSPKKKYKCIIAISTLEHVGWHEIPYEKNKILLALKSIRTLLTTDGVCIFSVPIGLNSDLDLLLRKKKLPVETTVYLKRNSWFNTWQECSKEDALVCAYDSPYPNANAICIASLQKR